ncbi:hypothetical protein R6Q57_026984 [Mikania cordata]
MNICPLSKLSLSPNESPRERTILHTRASLYVKNLVVSLPLSRVWRGNNKPFKAKRQSLLLPLHPRDSGSETTKFLTYKDDLVCRIVRFRGGSFGVGDSLDKGQMFIVDEELKVSEKKKFVRRVRYSKSPGWVHFEARIYPTNLHDVVLDIDKPMLIMKELNLNLICLKL